MASNNRATIINKFLKVVKQNFQPAEPQQDRTLLDHLLFACCLENSQYEDANQVFDALSQDFFDWNEVRVTSIRELAVIMKPLNDPAESAKRLKRVLHSLFETHYTFDLESMKKQNIGQTVKQLEQYKGTTAFTVSYVTQNALGGHSIPINRGLLESMRVVGCISDAEAAKHRVPGLERIVPKTKGVEVGSLLHQMGVELHRSPYGPTIRKLLLEIDAGCKDRLPKRPSKKKVEPPVKKPEPKVVAPEKPKPETKPEKAAPAKKKAVAKTATKKKAEPKKKVAKKKTVIKKKVAKKKAAKKTPTKKKVATKKKAKSSTKKPAKRKPR